MVFSVRNFRNNFICLCVEFFRLLYVFFIRLRMSACGLLVSHLTPISLLFCVKIGPTESSYKVMSLCLITATVAAAAAESEDVCSAVYMLDQVINVYQQNFTSMSNQRK